MEIVKLLSPKTKPILTMVLITIICVLIMRLGMNLDMPTLSFRIYWPLTPIFLAIFLLTEKRIWKLYLIAMGISFIFFPLFYEPSSELLPRVFFFTANAVEVYIAAHLITSILKTRISFNSLRDVSIYLICGVLIGPAIAANVIAISPHGLEISYWEIWRSVFLAHAIGQLTLTPTIVLWASGGISWLKKITIFRLIEAFALALCLIVAGFHSFNMSIASAYNFPLLLYVPFALFFWAATRFSSRGIYTAVLVISFLLIWETVNGRGVFAVGGPSESVLSLQLFIIAISIPFLLFCAVLEERKQLSDDIRRRAESDIESNKLRLQAIIDTMVDGLITIGPDGVIETFNPAAERIFGYDSSEVVNRNVKMLMPKPYAVEHDGYLKKYINTGERKIIGLGREVFGLRKDGSEFPMELGVAEVKTNENRIFTGIVRDISEQKRNLSELAQAREFAEQANRAKSDFVATMSHEIRTPLNGIIGMSEILELQDIGADERRMLQTIRNSSFSLSRIVDDILDFSKIEAGKLALESVSFPVARVVEGVAEMLMSTADKQRVLLNVFIDPKIPVRVYGDPTRLRQILVNLVGNAIKFSGGRESGGGNVLFRVELSEDDKLQFKIIDNGIGIEVDAQEKLFEPFSQAEQSTTRRYGGTGLGLVISNNLAQLMGGNIEVESELDQGSTFTLLLPCQEAPAKPTDAAPDISGLRVLGLLCDSDNPEALRSYLQAGGASLDLVGEEEAIENFRALSTTHDVLAIGSHFSDQEQYELISSMGKIGELPPQLLLTRNRSAKLGMRDTVCTVIGAGPVMSSAFVRSVSLLGGRITLEPVSLEELIVVESKPDIATEKEKGRSILLIEDNVVNQDVITRQLNILGYSVEIASDGQEGVEKWKSGGYGLVLMDCHMPIMDGYDATALIRKQEKIEGSQTIPIIAITANALEGEQDRCLAAGMDSYLSKPLQLEALGEELQKWIAKKNEPLAINELEHDVPLMDDSSQKGPIDLSALVALVGDDPALHLELLHKYAKSTPAIVEDLSVAYKKRDAANLADLAHKLKSSTRAMGANGLADVLQRLETAGREGDWIKIDQDFPKLETQAEEVMQYIRSQN